MSERAGWSLRNITRGIVSRALRLSGGEVETKRLPAKGSFFPWSEISRYEQTTGKQWIDNLPLGFRNVDLEGTRNPDVQKEVASALVNEVLESIQGKKVRVAPEVLPDGRVVGYRRNVLKGGDFVEGLYVIDPNSKGDDGNFGEVELAEKFIKDVTSIDTALPSAQQRIGYMIDAQVNLFMENDHGA